MNKFKGFEVDYVVAPEAIDFQTILKLGVLGEAPTDSELYGWRSCLIFVDDNLLSLDVMYDSVDYHLYVGCWGVSDFVAKGDEILERVRDVVLLANDRYAAGGGRACELKVLKKIVKEFNIRYCSEEDGG